MRVPRSIALLLMMMAAMLGHGRVDAANISINCGGAAASPYVADVDFAGGATASVTNAIDTSLLTGTVPPQAVLQSNRYGNYTYTIPGFTAGSAQTVTLYFAEEYWTAAGKRTFNVTINGTQVLSAFDIFATTGATYKAVQKTFNTTANASGQIVITTATVVDNAQINGIAIVAGAGSAPSAPTNLAATAGNTQISLTWTSSSGATSYNVYRGTAAGGESATAIATGLTGTTYTNTGLTNGTAYYYTVKAVNTSGTSAASNEAHATPVLSAPGAPSGLTATGSNAQVALSWTAGTGASTYNLYRGTTAGGESATAIVTGLTGTTYTNTGLTNGTAYYYTVKAVNTAGTSAASNEASATPAASTASISINCGGAAASPFVADVDFAGGTATTNATTVNTSLLTGTIPPQTVLQSNRYGAFTYTIPGFTAGSAQTVTLYFSEEYWTAAGKRTFNVSINATQVLAAFDIFAAAGAQFKAVQRSFNTTANASGQIVITTTNVVDNAQINGIVVSGGSGGTAPAAPTGLAATPGATQVALTWSASTGATSYNVYRGLTAGGESATAVATGITGTGYTNTGLTNGTTYYFTVKAVNASGTSGASNEANATPIATVTSYVPSGYALAWSDDFNQGVGNMPSAANWNMDTGIGANNDGWGNWEQETYVADASHAHIIADTGAGDGQALQIQATNDGNWATYGFHSARLNTTGKFMPTYGYIELRAKLPSGQGIWPAFWALGNNINQVGWPACGEMDMMEMFGNNATTDFASYHMGTSSAHIDWTATVTSATFQSQYHVFGLLWTPTGVTNYLDGVQFETHPSSSPGWVFNHPENFILNLAVGGIPPGNVTQTGTTFPQNLDVDYVRVYEPGSGVGVPPAPVGLAAVTTTGQIALTWTPSPGATSYNIYRGTTAGGESATALATGITAPNYTNTGLTSGTTYYYTVKAVNASGTSGASNEASGTPSAGGAPDFGPNVFIFTPSTPAATIQSQVNTIYTSQQTNQFGTQRYAMLFTPGTYAADIPVGFYTQVLGLGMTPDATTINGYVSVDAHWNGGNATQNFWRGIENLAINPSDSGGTDAYAVSQAAPMRRTHIKGNLVLADMSVNPPGWASGGFLGDSLVDGAAQPISQQQWLSRNSQWASWSNGVWNMVFVGCVNAPATSWPSPPYTNVGATPVIREKPFLNVDAGGNYFVFVPSLKSNVTGVDWQTTQTGTNIPIGQFYIAKSSVDNATTINNALNSGKNILFTPGVYALNGTILVNNPNTVILGIGLPTLQANTGANAMQVADVDGVTVAGILFESASNVNTLLQVGPAGSSASHASNPTLLADVFTRVGGAVVGTASANVVINSSNVIGDDFWLWRADHGNAGTVGWTTNPSTNGLIVNGQNVTIYGLAVEHFAGYQTLWNGNGGRTYFYQSEAPYDVPNQASWLDGSINGYASYKVANTVTSHNAYGLGVYCYFNVNPSGVALQNAIEAPTTGSNFTDLMIDSLGGMGTINSIINGQGAAVLNNGGTTNETSYQAHYP